MKRWLLAVLILLSSACSSGAVPPLSTEKPGSATPPYTPTPAPQPTLTNYGQAPELTNEVWLNTDQPLRLSDLRGQVVLLEMWTFG